LRISLGGASPLETVEAAEVRGRDRDLEGTYAELLRELEAVTDNG
jgi:hypothetical protein